MCSGCVCVGRKTAGCFSWYVKREKTDWFNLYLKIVLRKSKQADYRCIYLRCKKDIESW